ncbi:MAG TPA: galactokinase [Defluviitaleaceae bacterium]|nr:galactokinase [Defluviitaleaceae bacterium]
MNTKQLMSKFTEIFGEIGKPEVFFAPGRINLIGENIDYNGGRVLPCALDFGTTALARKRKDSIIKLASMNYPLQVTLDLNRITFENKDAWGNYPKGVIDQFLRRGFTLGGFEALYYGTIPTGAGLSSSASIELVTAMILKSFFDCDISIIDMIKLCQDAENQFVGVNCGIMDQFAIGMGKKNMAIYLDCDSLNYEYVPIPLKGIKLVIGNTNKKRTLADSKYNERRRECERALAALQNRLDIKSLCNLTPGQWEENKDIILDPVIRKRAEHVIYENARVKEAVEKLSQGDIMTFGKLLNQSHESLRDLYEVTGFELDSMVEEAWKQEGVLGSRMTGAGFGGCTISLVKEEAIEEFINRVGENYKKKTGLQGDFYIAGIGDGVRKIRLEG